MARIRTVKPEFWLNEEISSVSSEAALLAIGLLNCADDEGYFKANPALLSASVFPLRELSVSVQSMITELSNIGYIRLFNGTDGKVYGEIIKFKEHQKINRPTASKIKDLESFTESSVSPHEQVTTGKEGKGKEQGREQGKETTVKQSSTAPDVQEIFEHWQKVMNHPNANLDDKRKKLIAKPLKDGYTVEDLKAAITGCSYTGHNMGENDRGQRYDGLNVIFRDGDNIDRFIGNYQNPPRALNKQEQLEHSNQAIGNDWLRGEDHAARQ